MLFRREASWLVVVALCVGGVGCSTSQPEAIIVVPSAAERAPDYQGDGAAPRQRYVVRMSDGERDWEVEFPEVATGYEMRIPLKDGDKDGKRAGGTPGMVNEQANLTEADKELLREQRRQNPDIEREGVYKNGKNVLDDGSVGFEPGSELDKDGNTVGKGSNPKKLVGGMEAEPSPTRPSLLLGVDEVRKLFRDGNYEVAIIKLRDLENAYPNNVTILSMKGTLWHKLGRPQLARNAWEKVLQIDPRNKPVLRALKRLNKGTARRAPTRTSPRPEGAEAESAPPPQPARRP